MKFCIILFTGLFNLCLAKGQINIKTGAKPTKLTLALNSGFSGDTAFLTLNYLQPGGYEKQLSETCSAVIDQNGQAVMVSEKINGFAYAFVSYTHHHIPMTLQNAAGGVGPYLIQQGDDITVRIHYNDSVFHAPPANPLDRKYVSDVNKGIGIVFSGKGAEKFKLYHQFTRDNVKIDLDPTKEVVFANKRARYDQTKDFYVWYPRIDSFLNRTGKTLDKTARDIYRADMVGWIFDNSKGAYPKKGDIDSLNDRVSQQDYIRNRNVLRPVISDLSKDIPGNICLLSANYVPGLFAMECNVYRLSGLTNLNYLYNTIKTSYSGILRDRLLFYFFHFRLEWVNNKDSLLHDAFKIMTPGVFRNRLSSFTARSRGVSFYNFQLPDNKKKIVTLSGLKGKTVFIDFYFRGCTSCAELYHKAIHPAEAYFKNDTSVVFVSICADQEREEWLAALASGLYTTTSQYNVINLYTAGQGFGHPVLKYYDIHGYPCPIILDRKGRIANFDEYNKYSSQPAALINDLKAAMDR